MKHWKNLALSAILALTTAYSAKAADLSHTTVKPISQGTKIEQRWDGKPVLIAQTLPTSTAHDGTALRANGPVVQEQNNLAQELYKKDTHVTRASVKSKSIDEHCTTCPRPLGPLQPATIFHYDANNIVLDASVQRLNAKEKCDRITKGLEDCIYRGQRIEAHQPLTAYQKNFFRFVVQPEKGLTKEQANAVRDIWRDGKATYDELERYADVLPKDTDGKPYAAATLFSQVRQGKEECSYGMKVRAVKCELPPVQPVAPPVAPPQVTLPPPQPQAPPEIPQQPSPVPTPVVELPENHWVVGLGYGKTATDITTSKPAHSELCPTLCDNEVTNHLFKNTKETAKLGYEQGNFAAAVTAQHESGKDKQENFGNFGGLKRFYATQRTEDTVGVKGTYLLNNGPVRIGPEAGAQVTRTELGDTNPYTSAKTTASVNTHEEKVGVALATGQLDQSYAKISGGVKKGDIAPGIVAPSAQSLPAFSNMTSTLNFTAPYAGADARLRVFNHLELSGNGEYTFMRKSSPIKKMWDANVGAMYWTSTSTLQHGLGFGVEYGKSRTDVLFGDTNQTMNIKNDKPPVLFKLEYRFNMPWER